MSLSRFRTVSAISGTMATALLLSQCGKLPGGSKVPGAEGACEADISSAAAIASTNFGLQPELEAKVKASLSASAHLQAIAVQLEADVASACSNLAKDLGAADPEGDDAAKGPGKKAEAACKAAVDAIAATKAKASGSLKVEAEPAECTASMSVMADCAAECEAELEPGKVEVKCEGGELSGGCEGKCEGSCTLDAGAKCEGSCSGKCEGTCSAEVSGKCDGACNGKCDGKDSKGKCSGVCDGECSGKVDAHCGGTCNGSCNASCEVKAEGSCSGTCSGKCSVEFKEPMCSGKAVPPKLSAECKANCDAEVTGKLECTPPRINVKLEGAADVEAALKLRDALYANLPALLKVSVGMQGRLEDITGSVQASLSGVEATVKSGGAAALRVGGCFAASLKAQAKASASISISVKASASASGAASTG